VGSLPTRSHASSLRMHGASDDASEEALQEAASVSESEAESMGESHDVTAAGRTGSGGGREAAAAEEEDAPMQGKPRARALRRRSLPAVADGAVPGCFVTPSRRRHRSAVEREEAPTAGAERGQEAPALAASVAGGGAGTGTSSGTPAKRLRADHRAEGEAAARRYHSTHTLEPHERMADGFFDPGRSGAFASLDALHAAPLSESRREVRGRELERAGVRKRPRRTPEEREREERMRPGATASSGLFDARIGDE
jgi:hypothetical protein